MGIFDEALEQSKLQAQNSAMATEATLIAADEARTANMIAYLMHLSPVPQNSELIHKLRTEIEKRLDIA